ncbi:MAG: hypothetical protein ACYTG5_17075 [Planctomycetota bacterium]|jgi:hypothetical protein
MKSLPLIFALLFLPFGLNAQDISAWTGQAAAAIESGDDAALDQLIRQDPQTCLRHFKGLAFDNRRNPDNEKITSRMAALKAAWVRVYEGNTLEKMDRWVQLLSPRNASAYEQAEQALAKGFADYKKLKDIRSQERGAWEDLRDSMRNVARGFETVGAGLEAAQSYALIALIIHEMPESTFDDERDSLNAIEQFLSNRQTWEWTTDDEYKTNENARKVGKAGLTAMVEERKRREASGYDANVRGVSAYLVPDANDHEVVSDLKFKALRKPQLDMAWQGGSSPLAWARVEVAVKGAKRFDWFKGTDLFMQRPAANSFGVSLDPAEDSRSFVEATVANRVKDATKFYLDTSKTRPYAMWFFVGGQQELFQGFPQNLAPVPERASVCYKSASSWETEIAEETVVFYDDNSNGKLFEEDPYDYGLNDYTVGASLDDEVRLPSFDGMKIGKGPIGPYSEWVQVGENWYHMRGKKEGAQVGVRPVNTEYFKTGTLQMVWKGSKSAKPSVLIVNGNGDFKGARFNLAGGKPVTVPVGRYYIAFGRLEKGKGARLMSANILAGDCPDVEVKEGENSSLEIGGPFRLDYTKKVDGEEYEISAFTIKVRGVGGEIYTHINGAAPAPDVLSAKAADGKGAKTIGGFVSITDSDTLVNVASDKKYAQKINITAGFFPVAKNSGDGDPVLFVDVPEGMLVGLSEKKNKLFGKLTPIYK